MEPPNAPPTPTPFTGGCGIFVAAASLRLARRLSPSPFRPGIGCLNIGNACGVYAVFSTLMLTKSALDLLRALRPTHTSIPRELRVSSYSATVDPLLASPHPRNT